MPNSVSNSTYPHFVIKNNPQKGGYLFSDIITPAILRDVCKKVTGRTKHTYEFVNGGYNKGRLATIRYQGTTTYVSFSERGEIKGRNYFFQSLTTALVEYYLDTSDNKRICYYFLPLSGNAETRYFRFMYRLMATAGVEFLNADSFLKETIYPFVSVDDVVSARYVNKIHNRSNNSTYLTRSSEDRIQIYGKTYGANKKETTLLCIAVSRLTSPASQIELYEICEQDLSALPAPDQEAIRNLGNVKIIPTDLTMEKNEFYRNNSLRSPRFIYNLLERLGPKKCALCGCEMPELVEGAHIWSVTDIKRTRSLSIEERIKYATDGENGIWLCENHHKMFDEDLLTIDPSGMVKCKPTLEEKSRDYITDTTPITQLPRMILTPSFAAYLRYRYAN